MNRKIMLAVAIAILAVTLVSVSYACQDTEAEPEQMTPKTVSLEKEFNRVTGQWQTTEGIISNVNGDFRIRLITEEDGRQYFSLEGWEPVVFEWDYSLNLDEFKTVLWDGKFFPGVEHLSDTAFRSFDCEGDKHQRSIPLLSVHSSTVTSADFPFINMYHQSFPDLKKVSLPNLQRMGYETGRVPEYQSFVNGLDDFNIDNMEEFTGIVEHVKNLSMKNVKHITGSIISCGINSSLHSLESMKKLEYDNYFGFYYCDFKDSSFPMLREIDNGNCFLLCTLKDFSAPQLEKLGDYTFKDASFGSIDLPNLKTAGEGTFYRTSCDSPIALPSLIEAGFGMFHETNLSGISAAILESAPSDFLSESYISGNVDLPSLKSEENMLYKTTVTGSVNVSSLLAVSDRCFYLSEIGSSLDLPYVLSVGNHAFYNATINGDLNLANNEVLGPYALQDVSIHNLTMSNVREIGERALYGINADNLDKFYASEAVTIGKEAFLNLNLDYILLEKAETIGDEAFRGNNLSGSLNLEFVKTIGQGAFYGNKLESVYMPAVKIVAKDAFNGCPITSVDMINVVTIGDHAFYGSDIREINIPMAGYIGDYAFCGSGISNIQMPSVGYIGDYAFCGSDIQEVSMPIVKSIGDFAFKDNPMTYVDAENLHWVGESAFENCKFERLSCDFLEYVGPSAFKNCELMEFKAPHLKEIGDLAFYSNNLTEIRFDELQSIGNFAFKFNHIEDIHIPNVHYIGDENFIHSTFKTLEVNALTEVGNSVFDGTLLNEVHFPALTKVGDRAFLGCPLEVFDAPNIESVGEFAFSDAFSGNELKFDNLKSMRYGSFIDADITSMSLLNLTEVSDHAFERCPLKYVEFSNELTYIGEYAFSDTCLEKVYVPPLCEMQSYAFSYIESLTEARVDASSVADNAFHGCTGLTKFSGDIEFADHDAFYGCGLVSVDAPKLTKAANNAFAYCPMTDVKMPLLEYAGFCAFLHSGITTLDMPNLEHIGQRAFGYCDNLESVSLPAKVVEKEAFQFCTNLKHVSLPNAETVGSYSFQGSGIKTASLPAVWEVEEWTFLDCGNLTEVDVSTAFKIKPYAFQNCSELVSLNMEMTNYFSAASLNGCVNMKHLNMPLVFNIYDKFENTGIINIYAPAVDSVFEGDVFDRCEHLERLTLGSIDYESCDRLGDVLFYDCVGVDVKNYDEAVTFLRLPGESMMLANEDTVITFNGEETGFPGSRFNLPESEAPANHWFSQWFLEGDASTPLGNETVPFILKTDEAGHLSILKDVTGSPGFDCMFNITADGIAWNPENGDVFRIDPFYYDGTCDPTPVTAIAPYGFEGCKTLKEVNLEGPVTYGTKAFFGTGIEGDVKIDGGSVYGDGAFANCQGISSFTVTENDSKNNLTSIEGVIYTLGDVRSLMQYPAGSDRTCYDIIYDTSAIADYSFYGSNNLTTVTMPPSVTSIGKDAFAGCDGLEIMTIPDTVEEVADSAFGDKSFFDGSKKIDIRDLIGKLFKKNADGFVVVDMALPETVMVFKDKDTGDVLLTLTGTAGSDDSIRSVLKEKGLDPDSCQDIYGKDVRLSDVMPFSNTVLFCEAIGESSDGNTYIAIVAAALVGIIAACVLIVRRRS